MDLKTTHKSLSPVEHELEIEVPWNEIEKRIPDVINELKPNVEIDGFRKGKAPNRVIRTHVGEKRILQRAAEITAGEALNEAIQQLDKKPLAPPDLDLGEIAPDEPLKFKVKYFIEPPRPEELVKEISAKHRPDPTMTPPDENIPLIRSGIPEHFPVLVVWN